MSQFDYFQYRYEWDDVETRINSELSEDWREETLAQFRTAIELSAKARIYIALVDKLLDGDISEDIFHTRLKDQLNGTEAAF